MTTPPQRRARKTRKTSPGTKPKARQLNVKQRAKHRAMVAKMHEQRMMIAEAEAIQAEWNLYSLRLNKELGLKPGEGVSEDGKIVSE